MSSGYKTMEEHVFGPLVPAGQESSGVGSDNPERRAALRTLMGVQPEAEESKGDALTHDAAFSWLIAEADRLRGLEVARLAAEAKVTPAVWLAKCSLDVLLRAGDSGPVWTFEAKRRGR